MLTNGIRLNVIQTGPENGPLVIFLHGFPEFSDAWRKQIPAFVERGFRVWVPDQRGYHLSDKPPRRTAYHLNELSADILGLIRNSGRRKVFLVGHDWGGVVAWTVAHRHPEWIEKVAILNAPHPQVFRRYALCHPKQLLKSWYIFLFQVPNLPENRMRRDRFAFLVRSLKGTSRRGTFPEDEIERYRRAWAQPGALTGMVNWYRNAFAPLTLPKIKVKPPVVLIWGSKDLFMSEALAPRSIARCEQGKLVIVPEATHWVQHEEPQLVNRTILEFFASPPAA